MKKKILIIALSLLASAGTTYSTEEVGNLEVAGRSTGKTYVIFLTDKYGEQGTFHQGRLLVNKNGFRRKDMVLIGGDSVIVGQVHWSKEVSGVNEGDPSGVHASDLFGEREDFERMEEVLEYLKEGIWIATPEEHQELGAYQEMNIELFKKLYQLHDCTLLGFQACEGESNEES